MSLPFNLPPVSENSEAPIWNGKSFSIGNQNLQLLEYGFNNDGWNDDLTSFHEENAGENHFIDKASRNYALGQIKRHIQNKPATILEIGCSSGFMLNAMQKSFPNALVMGADVVREPLIKLGQTMPNTPLMRFNLIECPLPDNCVDVVVMLNVLEHIENDAEALRQVKRILKPDGVAVLEVPAGPQLYDAYDKILMHYRRYTLKQLRELAIAQGFSIQNQSHLGFLLYPGFAFVKKRNKRLLSESEAMQKQAVEKNIQSTGSNKLLDLLMKTELVLGQLMSYPIGIRCLMTCKKP